jgi:hypothetical protein
MMMSAVKSRNVEVHSLIDALEMMVWLFLMLFMVFMYCLLNMASLPQDVSGIELEKMGKESVWT